MAWSAAARQAAAATRRAHAHGRTKPMNVGVHHVLQGVPVGTSRTHYAHALKRARRNISKRFSAHGRNVAVRASAQKVLTVAAGRRK